MNITYNNVIVQYYVCIESTIRLSNNELLITIMLLINGLQRNWI